MFPTLIQSKFRIDNKRSLGKDGNEKKPWSKSKLYSIKDFPKCSKKIQNFTKFWIFFKFSKTFQHFPKFWKKIQNVLKCCKIF